MKRKIFPQMNTDELEDADFADKTQKRIAKQEGAWLSQGAFPVFFLFAWVCEALAGMGKLQLGCFFNVPEASSFGRETLAKEDASVAIKKYPLVILRRKRISQAGAWLSQGGVLCLCCFFLLGMAKLQLRARNPQQSKMLWLQ